MIFVLLGLPSSFTDFGRDVCLSCLRHIGTDVLLRDVSTRQFKAESAFSQRSQLEVLASYALEERGATILALADDPSEALKDALRRSDHDFMVFLDDPRRVVRSRIRDGVEPKTAIREIAASCAALVDLHKYPNAFVFHRDTIEEEAENFGSAVAKFLDTAVTRKDLSPKRATIGRYAAGELQKLSPIEQSEASPELDSSIALVIDASLSGFAHAFRGQALGPVIATREFFATNETSDHRVGTAIDVTGRPRCLIFGPYLHIPAGNWTLRLVLAFSPEVAGTQFSVDVASAKTGILTELGRVTFNAISGRYIAQITFTHKEVGTPLEFRLFVDTAAFDGKVSLGYAELQRLEDSSLGIYAPVDWRNQVEAE